MVVVSVLMSSYNHGRYVAEAIESVLNQTFGDLELIIVDDASTDNSRQIIEQYSSRDKRLKAFFHQKNMGIPATANDCLSHVSGKYIAYIGSDDLWVRDKLEKQLRIIRNNGDKLVWSQARVINAEGTSTGQTVTGLLGASKTSGNLFEELLKEQYVFFQSLIFNVKILKGLRRETSLMYTSDHLFILELSANREFIFMDEPLAMYRIHGGNVTSKNRAAWMKERIALRKIFLKKYYKKMSNQTRADVLYKIGHAYYTLGEKTETKQFYLRAFHADHFHKNSILYLMLALTAKYGSGAESLTKAYYSLFSLFSTQLSIKR